MIPPAVPHAALVALRQRSRDRHERIERLLGLDASIDAPRYRAVLRGFHGFLGAWEPRVRSALAPHHREGFDARSRLRMLEHDLRDLHVVAPATPRAALDAVRGLPLARPASVWGSMYVIEGSALGGQVLVRRLGERLGLHDGRGLAYFRGHGERTGAHWREFRERCAAEIGHLPDAIDDACRSANDTFDALAACFTADATSAARP